MTTLELFFYVILPIAFVGVGYAAVRFNERNGDHHLHPGE